MALAVLADSSGDPGRVAVGYRGRSSERLALDVVALAGVGCGVRPRGHADQTETSDSCRSKHAP